MEQDKTLSKIKELKYRKFGEVVIPCVFNDSKYRLMFLTADCEKNEEIIGLLARWRQDNLMWIPSLSKITMEGTRKWFKEKLVGDPQRLLFFMEAEGRYIGHLGFDRFDFDDEGCDIDNVIRGEEGCPGIMGHAVSCLMAWGRRFLGLRNYSLCVVDDNEKAIKLYERLGFAIERRIPVVTKKSHDGFKWVRMEPGDLRKPDKHEVIMTLRQGET